MRLAVHASTLSHDALRTWSVPAKAKAADAELVFGCCPSKKQGRVMMMITLLGLGVANTDDAGRMSKSLPVGAECSQQATSADADDTRHRLCECR